VEVGQIANRKKLEVVYESNDVIVMLAPHEDKLTEMILSIIKKSADGVTVKEIHSELKTIASEEKIRKIVNALRNSKIVYSSKGRYFISQSFERRSSPE